MDTELAALALLLRVIGTYLIPLSVPAILFGIVLSLLNKFLLRGLIPSTTIVVLCVMVFFLTIGAVYVRPEEFSEFFHQIPILEQNTTRIE